MNKILLGFGFLLFISCSNSSEENTFSLTGKTKEFDNNTYLYLTDTDKSAIIDSVQVTNNTFQVNTKVSNFPSRVILHTKDYKHYNFLWLENKQMYFDASTATFKEALITGSELNDLSRELSKATKGKSRKERMETEIRFVEEHPNSILSANMLSIYSSTWGKTKTKKLYESFSIENKKSKYGENIARYIQLNKELKIGDSYEDFAMSDIHGLKIQLSDLKADYTLLEFWSSNCGPCRKENSNLVKTYDSYKDKGFEIFSVSLDSDKESWLKAVKKDKLPWINVSDLKGDNSKAALIYDISGIPDNFLIDKNGIIINRNLRGEKLDNKLKELFKDEI